MSRFLRCCLVLVVLAATRCVSASHPVSVTEAVVYVQRDKVTVKIDAFVEDLYLFHGLKPNRDNFLEPADLEQARETHKQFLLERFLLRDAAGELLRGASAGVDGFEMPAQGISLDDLMSFSYGFRFEYPLSQPLEFLTVAQKIVDESAGIPAEMQLRVKQEGSESPYYAVLTPGDPVTIRFNWDRPPLSPDASEAEWEQWLAERREETLGITSYSSVYSFLYITDREIRHEILVPLATLEASVLIPRRDEAFLEVDEQPEAAEQIGAFFSVGNPITVDGQAVAAEVNRVDFYGVDFRDFAQRAPQRRVSMASARAGIILTYPLSRAPQHVQLVWDRFNRYIWNVKSVIYAYDDTLHTTFSRYGKEQSFEWKDPGRPPLPEIQMVETGLARPAPVQVPVASAICLIAMPFSVLVLWSLGAHRWQRLGAAVVLAGLAVLLWPYWQREIDHPFPPRLKLTRDEASAVFARLHENIYRAFDYHDESSIYEALARSVEGALLQELYLQIQQGLAMQEQGGALSRIEEVKLLRSEPELPPKFDPQAGFACHCVWTVQGTVEHWGHIHARTNQYQALFQIALRDNAWKITRAELLGEERVNFETKLRGL